MFLTWKIPLLMNVSYGNLGISVLADALVYAKYSSYKAHIHLIDENCNEG